MKPGLIVTGGGSFGNGLRQSKMAFEWSPWFYAWDVSSGCIWDLSIIKIYTLIKTKKDEKNKETSKTF